MKTVDLQTIPAMDDLLPTVSILSDMLCSLEINERSMTLLCKHFSLVQVRVTNKTSLVANFSFLLDLTLTLSVSLPLPPPPLYPSLSLLLPSLSLITEPTTAPSNSTSVIIAVVVVILVVAAVVAVVVVIVIVLYMKKRRRGDFDLKV